MTTDVGIALLRSQYEADRSARDADHAPASEWPLNQCRYCGGFRQNFAGTKLDGHALCVVGIKFQDLVFRTMRADPHMTLGRVAEALNVSIATVRAWYRAGAGRQKT